MGQPGGALPFLSATSPCPRLQLNPLSLLQGHRLGFALLSSPPAEDARAAPLAAGATRQDRGHAAAGLPVSLPPAEEQRRFGAGAQSQASPGSSSPRAPQGPGLARRARGRQRAEMLLEVPRSPGFFHAVMLVPVTHILSLNQSCHLACSVVDFWFSGPKKQDANPLPKANACPQCGVLPAPLSAALPQLTAGSAGLPKTQGQGDGDIHLPMIPQGVPAAPVLAARRGRARGVSRRSGNHSACSLLDALVRGISRHRQRLGSWSWDPRTAGCRGLEQRAWLGHVPEVPPPPHAMSLMLFLYRAAVFLDVSPK